MHLKTLTVRGFKSFAATTTFRFEPGITAVVGPNGSGKSNVVDAIAWVLGEQGAKALRGGSMSDVIFAGTPARLALGRAEVVLTIDNSDGALPIDFVEVSISRLMFRSGESSYAINGTACRLLDVQELMSDSGVGRELHVIVGQGQLDAVLQARPEDRRAFVEEAAGVLKHRKRKEKALRKLEAMAANMARVSDLTSELLRQLGPLGRQAEIARRAGSIQATVRDARLRLLADDLTSLRETALAGAIDEQAALRRCALAEAELARATALEAELNVRLAGHGPALAEAQEIYFRCAGLGERTRGLLRLAQERVRNLGEVRHLPPGRDPAELDAQAVELRAEQKRLEASLARDRTLLHTATQTRGDAARTLARIDDDVAGAQRSAADRREELAHLSGEVAAAESLVAARRNEIARLEQALGRARERARQAAEDFTRREGSVSELSHGEVDLDEAHETAARHHAELSSARAALLAREREQERIRDAASARGDALALALDRRDGAGAVLAGGLPGVLDTLARLITVEPAAQAAIAAALGLATDAVVVASSRDAATAVSALKKSGGGRAVLAVAGLPAPPRPGAPPIGRWALDCVSAPPDLAGALAAVLAGVVVVDDLAAARAVLDTEPGLRAVTRDGDVLGTGWVAGGSAAAPSALEMRAAADEARARAEAATAALADIASRLNDVTSAERAAAGSEKAALEALHASDARMAALGEQLALLGSQAQGASAEADRLDRQYGEAVTALDDDLGAVFRLRARLEEATAQKPSPTPDPAERDRAARHLEEAQSADLEARLAVRTTEERVAALAARAEQLAGEAAAERAARERFAADSERRAAARLVATDITSLCDELLGALDEATEQARESRDAVSAARQLTEAHLVNVRAAAAEAAEAVTRERSDAHSGELACAELRVRVQALEERGLADYGVAPDELLAGFGPQVPVPADAVDSATTPDAAVDQPSAACVPYDRAAQEKRALRAERQLAALGRVNPLALEEYEALSERHQFLASQLEDLRATRRDLLGIVGDVDAHIEQIFAAAFADVAREFSEVFTILFPGGKGRLELTEPDDVMASGIEVIAMPAGKKVSRLSLLSGGERSLAAIALLVAIFRARPSPFYVLDEVEAALDDTNLGRLLSCLEGLRERSQLIIVTHQKRTMEIADVLYGVSMRDDGVSAVVSQRLREPATA